MNAFVTFLLSLAGFVLHREYEDWAPRVSTALVRGAARCHPDRDRMKEEWSAEVAAIGEKDSQATGLTFALSVFVSYGLMAPIRMVEPTHIFLFSLMALHGRNAWFFVSLTLLGISDSFFDRRAIRRMAPGGIDLGRIYPGGPRSVAGNLLVTSVFFGMLAIWLWTAIEEGDAVKLAAAFLLAAFFWGLFYSDRFGSWLTAWRIRRAALLDPR